MRTHEEKHAAATTDTDTHEMSASVPEDDMTLSELLRADHSYEYVQDIMRFEDEDEWLFEDFEYFQDACMPDDVSRPTYAVEGNIIWLGICKNPQESSGFERQQSLPTPSCHPIEISGFPLSRVHERINLGGK